MKNYPDSYYTPFNQQTRMSDEEFSQMINKLLKK